MKLFLKNRIIFLAKNHCEIQVRTILVCTLFLIKYGTLFVSASIGGTVVDYSPHLANTEGSSLAANKLVGLKQ